MFRPIRVLHVDDRPEYGEVVTAYLAEHDEPFTVVTEADPVAALQTLADEEFDCLLADYEMPKMDGLELLAAVQRRHPDLPVILLTAQGNESVASEAIAAGVTDYIPKADLTDSPAVLAKRVTNAVERQAYSRQFETLVETLPGVVYRTRETSEWDTDFIGGNCESLIGYPADAIVAGEVTWGSDIIHPDDRAYVRDAVDSQLETGDTFELTYRILTADGDEKWVNEHGQRVAIEDGEGIFEGFITDVTALKESERQLARYSDTLEGLQRTTRRLLEATTPESAADIVIDGLESAFDFDTAGIWLATDDQLEPVAQTERGQTLIDEPPIYSPAKESLSWTAFEEGTTRRIDSMADHSDRANAETPISSELIVPLGEYALLNIGSTEPAAFSDADAERVQLWADTVTEAFGRIDQLQRLKAREDELTRQRDRLDQFASVVSHDIRNPINVASGRLKLAAEECDSEQLEIIDRALTRMEELIDDALVLARQGQTVGETEAVALADLVAQCWGTVATADATIDCRSDAIIRADRSRLADVFENLFRNSVEHGDSDVSITVGTTESGFYIADDGPGIPADDRERIFETGYSTETDGTGFGLAIVREIVEAHGWEIGVVDSEGGGARFEITGVDFVDR
ncbi:hybrid sensor histidine kinase/response regulator [Halonotius roseus]|uniref:histidine kinase n=1 Tax=Halonotius roseus TaxID=2511997 RepID=A0A544QLY1_9EURY|nr:response regulator [Halonotius roseus]TQQ79608.1 response regulator [Halonotius roseus]